ncbi:hypothetical protein AURDEDRAFT_110462 [Auricularia subglabra TFB-10046 SS5]|nr:hypothetical protein AURDEDRAFT_110462 [Auricularia subglabra TFB-10046 SS5]
MSFHHAPICKGLMIGLGITSIGFSLFDVKYYLPLQLVPHISRHHQYWRLLTQPLAYANSSELFIAELLLFQVGVQIERLFGNYRFASFLLVSTVVSSALSFASLVAFHAAGFYLNRIPAGPTALLFSILYQYSRIVPAAYTFNIFSLPLSNKSFTYLIASQLAFSQWPSSAVVALLGLLVGQLYRADIVGLKSYRLSLPLYNFLNRAFGGFIGSTRPPRRSLLAIPPDATGVQDEAEGEPVTTQSTRAPDAAGTAAAAAPSVVRQWVNELTSTGQQSGVRRVSDAEIEQVSSMFADIPRSQVVSALQQSPDIQHAVEMLLAR